MKTMAATGQPIDAYYLDEGDFAQIVAEARLGRPGQRITTIMFESPFGMVRIRKWEKLSNDSGENI